MSSPATLPQPPTVATVENPSTGVAENIPPVTVKRSTTLFGTASGPGMTWELQTLDSEAIGLLKAIITTVQEEPARTSDLEISSISSAAVHSSLEQSRSVSKKLAGLIKAFKQRLTHRSKTHQPQFPTVDSDCPEVSRVSEETGAIAAIPGLKLPDELFRDAYRSSQKDTIQSLLDGSFTIYLTDTAGQPEFQELLAALVAGPSVFFLVFKLTDSLNDQYVVEYVRQGAKKSKPYVSSFTVKEVLLQSLASIACTCSHVRQGHDEMKPIAPKVVLVGTHKDIASKKQIEAVQQELKETLQGTAYDQQNVVVYASRDEPVVTVDNLHPEGKDIDKVRAMIEKISKDPAFQISVPSPMLVLSLILRGLSNPVMTYQQCRSIAEECGIKTSQDLKVALWFLHTKLGVIRYFPHIKELRDIVIRDPQIIFDKITDLICSTFTFETTGRYSEEEFQKTGIFPLHEIERLTATSDELFTPVQVIKLLEYLHIIAPIRDERGIVQYFMPCVLTHATPVPKDTSADQLIPPLLVTFRCGYCPKGLFSALVVYLLSSDKIRGSAWQLKKDEMARGQVTFYAGEESNIITITTRVTHLEVSVQPTHIFGRQYGRNFHTVCSTIRESVDEGIVTVCKTLRYSCDAQFTFAFNCQQTSCTASKRHAAIREENKPLVLKCSKTGSVEGLSPYHRLWFGKEMVSVFRKCIFRWTLKHVCTGNSKMVWGHIKIFVLLM